MRDFEKARRAHAAKVEKNSEINNASTFKFCSCRAKSQMILVSHEDWGR